MAKNCSHAFNLRLPVVIIVMNAFTTTNISAFVLVLSSLEILTAEVVKKAHRQTTKQLYHFCILLQHKTIKIFENKLSFEAILTVIRITFGNVKSSFRCRLQCSIIYILLYYRAVGCLNLNGWRTFWRAVIFRDIQTLFLTN